MQRREFNKALVGGALGSGLTAPIDTQPASAQPHALERATPRTNTLMHVGERRTIRSRGIDLVTFKLEPDWKAGTRR